MESNRSLRAIFRFYPLDTASETLLGAEKGRRYVRRYALESGIKSVPEQESRLTNYLAVYQSNLALFYPLLLSLNCLYEFQIRHFPTESPSRTMDRPSGWLSNWSVAPWWRKIWNEPCKSSFEDKKKIKNVGQTIIWSRVSFFKTIFNEFPGNNFLEWVSGPRSLPIRRVPCSQPIRNPPQLC